jgi:hypothetical protein
MFGLSRESLVGDDFHWGDAEYLKQSGYKEADRTGLLVTPTALGAELFLWAHGRGHLPPSRMLHSSEKFDSEVTFKTSTGIKSTKHSERTLNEQGD